MSKKRMILIVLSAITVVIIIVLSIQMIGRKEKGETPKIGFIMSGSVEETGWNSMHYEGIKSACENAGVRLLVKENVKEFTGECNLAIEELAKQGVGMIVLSSYGYSKEARELVKDYPEIVFYVNSSEYYEENMTSYFVRMYQARYLAGIVAGNKTVTGNVGYVAAMENIEVNRGINAFALGVKKANPDAEVIVAWTGAWDDAASEEEAAHALISQEGVDVLTYHQNQPNVVMTAEKAGIYSIGYHEALEGCSDKYLTSVVCKWKLAYEQILREYLVRQGNLKDNYWIGLEVDAVGLSEYSKEVTQEIQEQVENAKKEILTGKDVFSGIIYDNQGVLRCGEKESISDELLLEQFDWFVEGVRIYEN